MYASLVDGAVYLRAETDEEDRALLVIFRGLSKARSGSAAVNYGSGETSPSDQLLGAVVVDHKMIPGGLAIEGNH